jgi:hypothetical protein
MWVPKMEPEVRLIDDFSALRRSPAARAGSIRPGWTLLKNLPRESCSCPVLLLFSGARLT